MKQLFLCLLIFTAGLNVQATVPVETSDFLNLHSDTIERVDSDSSETTATTTSPGSTDAEVEFFQSSVVANNIGTSSSGGGSESATSNTPSLQVTTVSGTVTAGNSQTTPTTITAGETQSVAVTGSVLPETAIKANANLTTAKAAATAAVDKLTEVQNKIKNAQNDTTLTAPQKKDAVAALRPQEEAAIEAVKRADSAEKGSLTSLQKIVDAEKLAADLATAKGLQGTASAALNAAKAKLVTAQAEMDAPRIRGRPPGIKISDKVADARAAVMTAEDNLAAVTKPVDSITKDVDLIAKAKTTLEHEKEKLRGARAQVTNTIDKARMDLLDRVSSSTLALNQKQLQADKKALEDQEAVVKKQEEFVAALDAAKGTAASRTIASVPDVKETNDGTQVVINTGGPTGLGGTPGGGGSTANCPSCGFNANPTGGTINNSPTFVPGDNRSGTNFNLTSTKQQ